jgi:hypothetical protein
VRFAGLFDRKEREVSALRASTLLGCVVVAGQEKRLIRYCIKNGNYAGPYESELFSYEIFLVSGL